MDIAPLNKIDLETPQKQNLLILLPKYMESFSKSPFTGVQSTFRTQNFSAKRSPTLGDSQVTQTKQKQSYLMTTQFGSKMSNILSTNTKNRLSLNSRITMKQSDKGRPSLNPKMNHKLEQIKKTCLRLKEPSEFGDADEEESICESLDLEVEKEPSRVKCYLRKSKYQDRPSTIHFDYPKCCHQQNIHSPAEIIPIEGNPDLKYRLTGHQYKCVMNALEFNGFSRSYSSKDWNVYFDIACRDLKAISHMNKYQKISQFPGCWFLGRKDYMWKLLHKMRRKFPTQYDFVPTTYLFPYDFERFQLIRECASKDHLWIMKPAGQACGRGIKMITKQTKIKPKKDYLVCQYIMNPHLIDGYKYDLRIYVAVISYDPLKVYIFDEGLVRFATCKFTTKLKEVKKRFIHLTNFSVNKHSKTYVKSQEDGKGSKWSLATLKEYYRSHGIDDQLLFDRIKDVVTKTCISAESSMLDIHSKSQERRNCGFQLYGFDILVDSNLKPWLIEVNVCPSLSSSSAMDRKIKHTLLVDLLNLVGLQIFDRKRYEEDKKKEKQKIMTGQSEKKVLFSKNVNNLGKLTYQNCVELLSPEDWLILFELQQQHNRKGHFQLLFPVKQTMEKYLQLFQYPRYNNLMVWKWLNSRNFLEHLS